MTNTFEQPLVSIDVVPFRFVKRSDKPAQLQVATTERINAPYAGEQALPGVLLGAHETVEEAAYRALSTKLGVEKSDVLYLSQFGVFDNPDRDPRGATLSIAFIAVLNPEITAEWHTVGNNFPGALTGLGVIDTKLPFDHNNIVGNAKLYASIGLWSNAGLTAALLTDEFSTADAFALTSVLRGEKNVDATNFNRLLRSYATKVGTAEGGRGRRSTLWKF